MPFPHPNLSLALALCALSAGCDPEPDPPGPTVVEASEEAFTADAGDLMLEGTLLLPHRGSYELVPGVVLFHGSGAQSRDSPLAGQLMQQFGFEILIFEEIAEHLQDAGYAV